MAKVIFYLHAKNGQSDELIRAATELASNELFQRDRLQLTVMQPRSADVLAVPPDSQFLAGLDTVLEIAAPLGQALRQLLPQLQSALVPVLDLVDKGQSHVVAGYARAFQESGPKPVRYHYLMYRLADFSHAEYLDYYVHSHSRFGLASPLADYYQNYLDQEAGQEMAQGFGLNVPAADSISELRFASVEDYLSSNIIREIGPQASADEELFVDRKIGQSFSMDVLLDTRE
jgi:hypothetical protein